MIAVLIILILDFVIISGTTQVIPIVILLTIGYVIAALYVPPFVGFQFGVLMALYLLKE